jgi:hypothetical protein
MVWKGFNWLRKWCGGGFFCGHCDAHKSRANHKRFELHCTTSHFIAEEVMNQTHYMKIRPFWDNAPCSLVVVDRLYRGAYCLQHQADKAVCTSETPIYSETTRGSTPEGSNRHIASVRTLNLTHYINIPYKETPPIQMHLATEGRRITYKN